MRRPVEHLGSEEESTVDPYSRVRDASDHGIDGAGERLSAASSVLIWCSGQSWSTGLDVPAGDRSLFQGVGASSLFSAIVLGGSAGLLAGLAQIHTAWAVVAALIAAAGAFNLRWMLGSRMLRPRPPLEVGRQLPHMACLGFAVLLSSATALVATWTFGLVLFAPDVRTQADFDASVRQRNLYELWVQDIADIRQETRSTYSEQLALAANTTDILRSRVTESQQGVEAADRRLACESMGGIDCNTGTGTANPGVGYPLRQVQLESDSARNRLTEAQRALDEYTVVPVPSTFTSDQLAVCGYSDTTELTRYAMDGCRGALLVEERVAELTPARPPTPTGDGLLTQIGAYASLFSSSVFGLPLWTTMTALLMIILVLDLVPLLLTQMRHP